MENINNSYFDGYYKDIWRAIIPAELTAKETSFMLEYFNLQEGSKALDIMCGYGRHAIALAKKGVEVTAVDNLGDYINEIKEAVSKDKLPVKVFQADVIQFRSNDVFDLAICMGNSLNFFNANDTYRLLFSIAASLKKGGHLFINTWSLAEIAIKQFTENSWATVEGLKFLNAAKYLFHPTRIETETTVIANNGDIETKTAIDYIYSVAELEAMLDQAGFSVKEIYSIPGRKKFTLGEPRAYIVAEKH